MLAIIQDVLMGLVLTSILNLIVDNMNIQADAGAKIY